MTTATESASEIVLGQWIDGYQVISQAPVGFIRGSRQRRIDEHLITGSWSDPWWLYCPERGWAVVKRWKNKDTQAHEWADGHIRVIPVPARNELVITPWEGQPDNSEENGQ